MRSADELWVLKRSLLRSLLLFPDDPANQAKRLCAQMLDWILGGNVPILDSMLETAAQLEQAIMQDRP